MQCMYCDEPIHGSVVYRLRTGWVQYVDYTDGIPRLVFEEEPESEIWWLCPDCARQCGFTVSEMSKEQCSFCKPSIAQFEPKDPNAEEDNSSWVLIVESGSFQGNKCGAGVFNRQDFGYCCYDCAAEAGLPLMLEEEMAS
jgi:hypothetical protein